MAEPRVEPDHGARSACGRFWYDRKAADGAVAFFPRHLRHTEGEWAGRPFLLAPWQEHDIVRPLFGWKREGGSRRYRVCDVWVPRKNGKTELAAGILLLMLIGDGEFAGQVYAMGVKEKQAKLVFNKAAVMVAMSPDLSAMLDCFNTSIFCSELMASILPLAGEPKGSHGMSMSGLVGDEMHEWREAAERLYTFVHQSSGARRQPLEFRISTFGEMTGYGYGEWQYDERLLAGEVDDPERLVVAYRAGADDDWTDPATWAKANPNYPVSPKHEYLEAECRRAQELPRAENDFKRYHLNIWTEQDVRWLPMDKWDACGHPEFLPQGRAAEQPDGQPDRASPPKPAVIQRTNDRWRRLHEGLAGRYATAGLDLSATTDLTALVWMFPPLDARGRIDEAGRWTVLPRFFLPAERIAEAARRDRVPYDEWVRIGALTATPGNVVDYDFVKSTLFQDAQTFRPGPIAIDRWNATQIAVEIAAEGLNAEMFGQGFASMSAPSKELERLVLDTRLDHGGHPVLRWCAQNVSVATDPAGNIKPNRENKRVQRIDGIVAAVMGLGVAMGQEIAKPSVYAGRGLLIL